VDSVSIIGRSTQGVKVMDLDGDDRLVALAKIVEKDEDDSQPDDEEPIGGPLEDEQLEEDGPGVEEPVN
jgi:DNA gyrase subunit A